MAHISSHHGGADESHSSFLVIFKVHGEAIHLWSPKMMQAIGETLSFRISCHNVEDHSGIPDPDIQVFCLREPADTIERCSFHDQCALGELVNAQDMATFMVSPVCSSKKSNAFAIDLGLSSLNSDENHEKVGTAYVYLDPKFSSQGIQRTPIIARATHKPVGQIQIEYLIVTNPIAHGRPAPKPDWLFKSPPVDAGHRGAGSGRRMDLPGELLENTIASLNYAHRHGADMCELDVLVSADGVPVVYHDFDVDAAAAKQSSDKLGKIRVQVNEFTVKQLRDFRLLALHDGEGCPYTLNVPNQEENNRPFPTLAEVLDEVDETCGLNIEIKWPQLLENGKMEARKYLEINDFVGKIISVVEEHARNRRIVLESFDADLVILLRLKQDKFPVVFLSQGLTDRYPKYMDIRARSIYNGVYFAQAFDLAGVDLILDYYLSLGAKLVEFIKARGLVARAWGDINQRTDTVDYLKSIGVQCVTYDKIDLARDTTALEIQGVHNCEKENQPYATVGSRDEYNGLGDETAAIKLMESGIPAHRRPPPSTLTI